VDSPALLTASEVAELLRLNLQVVQRKLQAGEIPGYRIGRDWRIDRLQLMEWLEGHSNRRQHDDSGRWFDGAGRLIRLPAQRRKRESVLRRIAGSFQPDRTYRERDVNAVLRQMHDDVATIRRELVAGKLLLRTPAGVYKRAAVLSRDGGQYR
jgi:excisionase family DNA binding protein